MSGDEVLVGEDGGLLHAPHFDRPGATPPHAGYSEVMTEDLTRRLGTPLCSLVGGRGELHVWRPSSGVFVTRVVGYLSTDGAKEIALRFRSQIAEDATHIGFHDWSQMEDYDFDARTYLTRVTYEVLPSVKAAHFFVRSRVVAFGVQAANLLLHRFTLHPSETSFQRELVDTLVRRASAPPAATESTR